MKRKTVFLDQGEFMGGAEHFLLDFLANLSPTENRRLNPTVYGGVCNLYKEKLPAGVPRINFVLPAVKGGKILKVFALFKLVFTAKKLKKSLKADGVTQIFTNTPRAHLVALLLKKVWGWNGRWVVMMHDFTLKPEALLKHIGRQADIIIANSMPTRTWLRQHVETAYHDKLRLIENGVQTSEATQGVTEIRNLVNLGRIDQRKGQLLFAQAAEALQTTHPDLTFTIIGDSVEGDLATQAYETEVKAFTKERQLANMSFKPSVKNPLETIDGFDALIFTPTEPETFGRVVIEALSKGKLVLAFAQTGPKEILEHYERWLIKHKNLQPIAPHLQLVEINNAAHLAEQMAYFTDNPTLIKTYTQHAAEFVTENYNLVETKKRLAEILLV